METELRLKEVSMHLILSLHASSTQALLKFSGDFWRSSCTKHEADRKSTESSWSSSQAGSRRLEETQSLMYYIFTAFKCQRLHTPLESRFSFGALERGG